jgi:arsenite methyltransferase
MLTSLFLKLLNYEASLSKSGVNRIIKVLNIEKGNIIADIGSGGGFFTLVFAENVGEDGRVYAVDTNRKYLNFVERQVRKRALNNVVTVLGGSHGFDLPDITRWSGCYY